MQSATQQSSSSKCHVVSRSAEQSRQSSAAAEDSGADEVSDPDAMPPAYADDPRGEGTERRVADYIAGMTDSYAIHLFGELFI